MTIDVYGHPISGPYRAVLMALEVTGTPYDIKILDLMKNEQMNPEFIKVLAEIVR